MTSILLHIGYHKTGSQWLRRALFGNPETGYRWLGKAPRSHPMHRFVRDRPLEFDAAALRAAFDPLVARAQRKGLVPVMGWPRLSGSAYSGGYDSKLLADRMKAVFPEARVMMLIREQRSMLLSTYKQYVSSGGAATLQDFLYPATERGWRLPAFAFEYLEYHHLIAYYRGLFGAERVLALAFEEFAEDPRGVVERVTEFAGRSVPEEVLDRLPYDERRNPSASALGVAIARPLNQFGSARDIHPAPLFGGVTPIYRLGKHALRTEWQNKRVTRALAARSEQRLRQAVRAAVGDRYVRSNRITSELIGVDLGAYGWML
jgi:sulfotransferase family protein